MESWIITLFSIVVSSILIIKYRMLLKDIQEIHDELKEKVSEDTNLLISTSSDDKYIKGITSELNSRLKKLQQERQRFQQGDHELKETITNISHDIRTLLTAVNGYMDLIEKENGNEKVERYLSVIRNRIVTIEQLMDELFQYSVIVADNEMKLEKISINGVLEESILGFYAILNASNIVPEIHISEKPDIRNLNRAMLLRVFSNLMNNAVKYSEGDLKISFSEDGKIVFSNHTSKLTQIQVAKLFNRFYTVEEARKSTGLGLAIAKTLVESMKGSIRAKCDNNVLYIILEFPMY
ncbi:MAG: sensor histidine kinase [Oliverpabstia sp.]